jgi:hypothetical protein
MAAEISELPDRWILPLRDCEVTAVEWDDDDAVRFRLDPSGEIVVGLAALATEGSRAVPEARPVTLSQLGPDEAQRWVGSRVLSAVGFKNGALRVIFDNGWHLDVPATGSFVPASISAGESVTWSRDPLEEVPPASS